MKNIFIKHILIAILLFNGYLVYSSGDCDNLNAYLIKQGYSISCCGNSPYVLCDGEYIKSITFDASITDNYFKPISFNDFPIFEKLKHLSITDTKDSEANIFNGSLPSRFFELPELEVLEVTRAKIVDIPTNINTKSKLTKINLSSNNITAFPYQFKTLPKLDELDVSSNRINGQLSDEIKQFSSLTVLDIGNNQLEGELKLPESLEFISLNHNKFDTFSSSNSIDKLENIEAINNLFDDNIFHSLKNSKRLRTLTLGNNVNIKNIPDDIYLLNSLENLDISNTSISYLPNNFFALSNLNYLNISNNSKLKPYIVNFGNIINVCDFSNTDILCYQPKTCSFIFGYTTYTDCNDFEIEQLHDVNPEVTKYVSKRSNHFLKYINIAIIVLLIIAILSALYYFCQKKLVKRKNKNSKKEKDTDIVISPNLGNNLYDDTKSDSSLSKEHLVYKSNMNSTNNSHKSPMITGRDSTATTDTTTTTTTSTKNNTNHKKSMKNHNNNNSNPSSSSTATTTKNNNHNNNNNNNNSSSNNNNNNNNDNNNNNNNTINGTKSHNNKRVTINIPSSPVTTYQNLSNPYNTSIPYYFNNMQAYPMMTTTPNIPLMMTSPTSTTSSTTPTLPIVIAPSTNVGVTSNLPVMMTSPTLSSATPPSGILNHKRYSDTVYVSSSSSSATTNINNTGSSKRANKHLVFADERKSHTHSHS